MTTQQRLHVFLGTKAQYIKTAPLLRLLDERGVDYRLIDSGQHARISAEMRADLGVRRPDVVLGGTGDVDSVPQAIAWAARLAARLWSPRRLRDELFGGAGGICVVHGDTPSTLLATLLAQRAGLRVAHLEAGLRSGSVLHPFPEELIRLAVMHRAELLFAPDASALANLQAMRLRGRIVALGANTVVEALRHAEQSAGPPGSGPVVVTMHRVENLHQRSRVHQLVRLVLRIAAEHPVCFVLHGPTSEAFQRTGISRTLAAAGVQLRPLLPHHEFTPLLAAAPFVITDGGSIQEECALLGVPTLLWRLRTERPDGLGRNVVLSRYARQAIDKFLGNPDRHRYPPAKIDASPSQRILAELLDDL